MFQQSVVAATQSHKQLDDFEQFAVDELDAVIMEVTDGSHLCEADFCWLPSQDGEAAAQRPSTVRPDQQPSSYLERLLTIPQLPAPADVLLLIAVSASAPKAHRRPNVATFEEWLETDLGQEVYRRIMNNRHAVPMDSVAAFFDTVEDVQQKALIWLWQRWQLDPGYSQIATHATSLSHTAGCITKVAIRRARCMYAKRRREGREQQTELFAEDGYQLPAATVLSADTIRATDVHEHDRLGLGRDKKTDVKRAIERVTQTMVEHFSIAKGNHRRIPIEHITQTVIEGHMYHYTDRYNQTGNFRQFCAARGVSKNQIARWRPQIFDYLREELAAYASV